VAAAALTEESTSRFVQAGPIRVHYNEAGTGAPVIFCEGQGAGTSAWVVYHRVIGPLSQHYRCLLLDQPGYGKSDAVTVTDESRSTMYARTVRDFMDALGIPKASRVDMSFGAQTAQVFAIEQPERVDKLVLHASGMPGPTMFGHQPTEGILIMRPAFENPTRDTIRAMMDCFLYDGPSYSDEELLIEQRVAAWRSRPDQQEAWRSSKSIQRDLSADLHKIQAPVLQINGRNDRVQHLETALRLMNHLADSRLMIINRCGHWVPFERPDEFSRLVHDFLSH
jgi:2-hydroxy-6-oxonona-2,4-dienedioate hydrolase